MDGEKKTVTKSLTANTFTVLQRNAHHANTHTQTHTHSLVIDNEYGENVLDLRKTLLHAFWPLRLDSGSDSALVFRTWHGLKIN